MKILTEEELKEFKPKRTQKKCSQCEKNHPNNPELYWHKKEEFRSYQTSDGRTVSKNVCKECERMYRKEYRQRDEQKEKRKEQKKIWKKKSESYKLYRQRYDYLRNHKLDKDEKKKRKNKDKVRKLRQNPFYKLKEALIQSIKRKAKRMNYQTGNFNFEKIFGMKAEDYLKSELFHLLKDGMTYDNYGQVWVFDHIVPCSQANSEEEFWALQTYENFQPLSRRENAKKGELPTEKTMELCEKLLGRGFDYELIKNKRVLKTKEEDS